MIAYIKGELTDISEEQVVIEVGQIGYNVKVSMQTISRMPALGEKVILYTYTCVREDAFLLYGFLEKSDLQIFKKLITVNGIGPKGGLAILSVMNAQELLYAILAGDAKAIARAPGVGAKTAGRVILDLKDKVSLESLEYQSLGTSLGMPEQGNVNVEDSGMKQEAIEALCALGYGTTEAYQAVSKVEVREEMDTETILKLALKRLI